MLEVKFEAAAENTLLIALPRLFIATIAANASKTTNKAYSVKSCPDSSVHSLKSSFPIYILLRLLTE